MKILCVIDNLSTGGAQRQLINLARGLHRRGHEVAMFCYAPGALLSPYLERDGIPIYVQLKKSRFSPDVIAALRRTIDRVRAQVVVSYLNTPNFYAVLASGLSKVRPAVVVSERNCDWPGSPDHLERGVRQFYRFSQAIVVNSHHQRMNFLRRYPWMGNRVRTIYNGYDLQEFTPSPRPPDSAGLRILVVARVSRQKNGLCLVRALDLLKREHGLQPNVSWAGHRWRSGDNGVYLAEMESEIARLGLIPQWDWLDQRTDISVLLNQSDVLVHPSYGEGLPNVVCEALACGRPVILSDTLDHPRLVADGANGYLFDWRDPLDLARKIKLFYDLSPDERRRMGDNGRTFAEKNLSMDRYVGEFENLFIELTRSRERPAEGESDRA